MMDEASEEVRRGDVGKRSWTATGAAGAAKCICDILVGHLFQLSRYLKGCSFTQIFASHCKDRII